MRIPNRYIVYDNLHKWINAEVALINMGKINYMTKETNFRLNK